MLGPDLLLDPSTHDLVIQDGDLVVTEDLAQAVKIRLLFFKNEWFLDLDVGVPWFEDIFRKDPNLDQVRTVLRRTIAETPGIKQVTKLDVTLNRETRELSVDWAADSEDGEVSGAEVL